MGGPYGSVAAQDRAAMLLRMVPHTVDVSVARERTPPVGKPCSHYLVTATRAIDGVVIDLGPYHSRKAAVATSRKVLAAIPGTTLEDYEVEVGYAHQSGNLASMRP